MRISFPRCPPSNSTTTSSNCTPSATSPKRRAWPDIGSYMADLERDIARSHAAFVGAAVTEIASFRAQLSGPNFG